MHDAEVASLSGMPGDVRRLLESYETLLSHHAHPVTSLAVAGATLQELPASSDPLALIEGEEDENSLFPAGQLDQDLQQIDLRGRNSWRLQMDEVPSVELLEVHLVNAVAPFVINARLKSLMLRTPERDKHIVNVSAMEGQFYRSFKTTRHPHTNMTMIAGIAQCGSPGRTSGSTCDRE